MMKKELLANLKKITLLYVEDEDSTREELVYFLENKVQKLYVAKDGQEGYELYKEHEPDLVLSDVQMPKCDGISMSKQIKDLNPEAKIIILTAFSDADYLFKAIKLGIDDYKTKPIDIRDLVEGMSKISKVINLEKENKEVFNTLRQYKDIVDERSIVSKTDIKGVITYVNEPFEKISGFSKDELIGNTHSLIKHEETSVKFFKDMWDTLLEKKIWYGIVKNRAKNGEEFVLDTIIKPILDVDGNIVEFIALRTDITDSEMSKEYFKSKTIKATSNLKESIKKAKEYRSALDSSNIILIVSKDRKISYANDAFCQISGYTQEELIGQHDAVIKDKNQDEFTYLKNLEHLQNHVDKGNIWKGRVSNTKKNGELFHCNLTVCPLRNKDGVINEYLEVRHDLTQIEKLHKELELTQREVIYKLGEVGETRSKETGNHVKRVAEYSKLFASLVGLNEKEVNILFAASPMHDIGKIGIPDSILNKPGKLDDKEWEVMQTHSKIGYNILKDSTRDILKAAAIVSHSHHEKWDGTGYPNALKGEDIHIYGRITAIADVFDALGSERCYKKAWPLEKILELFENQRGKHFEPKLVDIFMENLERFLVIKDKYKD